MQFHNNSTPLCVGLLCGNKKCWLSTDDGWSNENSVSYAAQCQFLWVSYRFFNIKTGQNFPKTYIVCYEPHSWPIPRLGIPLSNLKHYLHTIRIDWYRFVLMFQLETFKGHYHVSLLRHLVLFYGVLLENSKAHLKIIVD